jgi:outer membrane protein
MRPSLIVSSLSRTVESILRGATAILVVATMGQSLHAQSNTPLTMQQAIDLALQNNHLHKIAMLRVDEKAEKVSQIRAKYLFSVQADAAYLASSESWGFGLETGTFGALPVPGVGYVPLPSQNISILPATNRIGIGSVMAIQPISQVWKIMTGVDVALADKAIAETEAAKAGQQVKLGVQKMYLGLLIAQKQREEQAIRLELADATLHDATSAREAGKVTDAGILGLQALRTDAEQNLLKAEDDVDDLTIELRHLIGLADTASMVLDSLVVVDTAAGAPLTECRSLAMAGNLDVQLAGHQREKADHGVTAAYKEYLPDISLIGSFTYQPTLDFLPKRDYSVALVLSWTLWDWGERKAVLDERRVMRAQAEELLSGAREDARSGVDRAYRKMRHAIALMDAARRALRYREEECREQSSRHDAGLCLPKDWLGARAAYAKSQTDYLSAQCNYVVSLSELQIVTGRAGGR